MYDEPYQSDILFEQFLNIHVSFMGFGLKLNMQTHGMESPTILSIHYHHYTKLYFSLPRMTTIKGHSVLNSTQMIFTQRG